MSILLIGQVSAGITINGILQGGLNYVQQGDEDATADFTVNRARFLVGGDINENVKFFIQTEKGDILDVKFIYNLPALHSTLCMGRFLPAYTYHMPVHTGKLGLVGYPFLTLNTAPWRQVGFQSTTRFGENIHMNLGLFNGANEPDNWKDSIDDGKDFLVSGGYKQEQISAGGYYYMLNAIGSEDGDDEGHRVGFFGKYQTGGIHGIAEYLMGELNDGKFAGYYVMGGLKFYEDKLEGLVRYDFWDPNTDLDDDQMTSITLGMNYYLDGYDSMFYLNYVINTEDPDVDNNSLVFQYQILFNAQK